FEDIEVAPPVRRIPLPLIGTIVSEIGNTFAELFIVLNQNWDVAQEPMVLDFPPLDPDTLESLEVTSLDLKIIPESVQRSRNPLVNFWNWLTFKRAHLKFIRRMGLYIATEDMYENNEWARVARYDHDEQGATCENKCISFETKSTNGKRVNLARILQDGGRIYIRPELDIRTTPKRTFNLAGEIRLRAKLNQLF